MGRVRLRYPRTAGAGALNVVMRHKPSVNPYGNANKYMKVAELRVLHGNQVVGQVLTVAVRVRIQSGNYGGCRDRSNHALSQSHKNC